MRTGKAVVLMLVMAATLIFSGCAAKQPPSAPVPGSINAFDATSFRVLSDAQAMINSIKFDVSTGNLTLSPTQKKVLNQAIADYNVGESAWQAYHAGATGDTTTLGKAITDLVNDIASLVSSFPSVKPSVKPSGFKDGVLRSVPTGQQWINQSYTPSPEPWQTEVI